MIVEKSTDVQGVGLVKDHKFRPWLWATSPPKERLPCSGGQFNQGASPSSTENIQQDIDVVANPIPRDVGSLISTDISGRMTTLSSTKGKEKVVEPSASGIYIKVNLKSKNPKDQKPNSEQLADSQQLTPIGFVFTQTSNSAMPASCNSHAAPCNSVIIQSPKKATWKRLSRQYGHVTSSVDGGLGPKKKGVSPTDPNCIKEEKHARKDLCKTVMMDGLQIVLIIYRLEARTPLDISDGALQ
ncbi:hypothetical protein ACOSQ4_016644 [Xanthoceras sorbifolium]